MKVRVSYRRLVFVGWNDAGMVNRIVQETVVDDSDVNPLDRIVKRLARPHILSEWDVEWCKRDECYYVHETGGWTGRVYLNQLVEGYREKFWAEEGIEFSNGNGVELDISEKRISELGYDRVHLDGPPEDLSQTCEEQSCYWCCKCDDMIPSSDLCEHMYWCDNCGVVITPDESPCCIDSALTRPH